MCTDEGLQCRSFLFDKAVTEQWHQVVAFGNCSTDIEDNSCIHFQIFIFNTRLSLTITPSPRPPQTPQKYKGLIYRTVFQYQFLKSGVKEVNFSNFWLFH